MIRVRVTDLQVPADNLKPQLQHIRKASPVAKEESRDVWRHGALSSTHSQFPRMRSDHTSRVRDVIVRLYVAMRTIDCRCEADNVLVSSTHVTISNRALLSSTATERCYVFKNETAGKP